MNQLRVFGLALLALLVAVATGGYFWAGQLLRARAPRPDTLSPRSVVVVGGEELPVYRFTSPLQQPGSARRYLKPGQGILYTFAQAQDEAWSARGLHISVSVAFLDRQGTILTILDLEPCPQGPTCPSYNPGVVYRQVLEVPRGWFAAHGLEPGAVVRLTTP